MMIMPYESPVLNITTFNIDSLSVSGTDCPVQTGDQDLV